MAASPRPKAGEYDRLQRCSAVIPAQEACRRQRWQRRCGAADMKCRGRLCVSRRGFVPAEETAPPTTSNRPNGNRALRQDAQRPHVFGGMTARSLLGRFRGQQSSSEPRQRRQQSGLSKPKIPTVAQDIPILVRRVVHTMVPRTCLMFVPNRPVVVDVQ